MSTYSTYNEAVEAEIVAPIATSEDALGKPVREAFDVDAIADATISSASLREEMFSSVSAPRLTWMRSGRSS